MRRVPSNSSVSTVPAEPALQHNADAQPSKQVFRAAEQSSDANAHKQGHDPHASGSALSTQAGNAQLSSKERYWKGHAERMKALHDGIMTSFQGGAQGTAKHGAANTESGDVGDAIKRKASLPTPLTIATSDSLVDLSGDPDADVSRKSGANKRSSAVPGTAPRKRQRRRSLGARQSSAEVVDLT